MKKQYSMKIVRHNLHKELDVLNFIWWPHFEHGKQLKNLINHSSVMKQFKISAVDCNILIKMNIFFQIKLEIKWLNDDLPVRKKESNYIYHIYVMRFHD